MSGTEVVVVVLVVVPVLVPAPLQATSAPAYSATCGSRMHSLLTGGWREYFPFDTQRHSRPYGSHSAGHSRAQSHHRAGAARHTAGDRVHDLVDAGAQLFLLQR